MSACHDVVAMETFQPNILYVAAIWSSGADLNRPEEFVALWLFAFVCSPLGSLRKVFGQRKQRSVCVGVTKGKKKKNNNRYSPFPDQWDDRATRCVVFLSPCCQKCQQHTPVVSSGGGRRGEDRMLMRTLEWVQGEDFFSLFFSRPLTAYTRARGTCVNR